MKSIYMVGFMGSGKSRVGELLARQLNIPFCDTDSLVEKENNISIAKIFRNYGEQTFRDYEHDVLVQLPTQNTIISTGGGIIERQDNKDWIKDNGVVVYLKTSWDEIVKRLKNDQSRPIWNNDQLDKKKLYDKREKIYTSIASIIVNTDDNTPESIADHIIQLINE